MEQPITFDKESFSVLCFAMREAIKARGKNKKATTAAQKAAAILHGLLPKLAQARRAAGWRESEIAMEQGDFVTEILATGLTL